MTPATAPANPPSSGAVPRPATADSPAVAWSRRLAVACLLGLILLGLAWELVLAPTGNRTLALKVLPLAFPLAGLLKNRMYTYRWVSLLVWLYFTEGVVRAFGDTGLSAALAGLEVLLCLLLFVACASHVRWRLKHAKALDSHLAAGAAPLQENPRD